MSPICKHTCNLLSRGRTCFTFAARDLISSIYINPLLTSDAGAQCKHHANLFLMTKWTTDMQALRRMSRPARIISSLKSTTHPRSHRSSTTDRCLEMLASRSALGRVAQTMTFHPSESARPPSMILCLKDRPAMRSPDSSSKGTNLTARTPVGVQTLQTLMA